MLAPAAALVRVSAGFAARGGRRGHAWWMVRLGLCCTFLDEPIKFRTTTARHVATLAPRRRIEFFRELGQHNADALNEAVTWCAAHRVGAFRVQSGLLPLYTHPELGWSLAGPEGLGVAERLRAAHPQMGLLFLSHYAESHYLMRILQIGTDSIGYRLKEKVGSVDVLSDTLSRIGDGEIVLDKPFVYGDFIVVGDLSGTVEKVGLKTTRLRSISGEQLILSNADLLSSRIRNYGRMSERRVVFGFRVPYGTPRDKVVSWVRATASVQLSGLLPAYSSGLKKSFQE